ncbi:MAG TPA: iron-containing redox enzyme family protein [Bacteriovoracaceae bacterium]|nr:iron-containing redox enzyme family protein [Bacteriovoracaceae bacterium]
MSFEALNETMKKSWEIILGENLLLKEVNAGNADRRLYALYLIQTFFYTSHNAKNQALVALNIKGHDSPSIQYMKYCFKQSLEETGHEMMAYHDLKRMGYEIPMEKLTSPLPETEAFIAYLYKVSLTGNPLRSLGYAFWAEDSYRFFGDIMTTAIKNMGLSKDMLTFFNEHSALDVEHSQDVNAMIKKCAKTQQDWDDISDVLVMSLKMTGDMLNAVLVEYKKLLEGKSRYNGIL